MLWIIVSVLVITTKGHDDFSIEEATIESIQRAFAEDKLTSLQLVDLYLNRIQNLNPVLRSVLEINPHARVQAEEADRQRRSNSHHPRSFLHGVPVLLKDTIATDDKMNTTVGSYALLGSVVGWDAGVVEKLRNVGAVILGKAILTEWYSFRALGKTPNGWCARGGQAQNPYVLSATPCGSSSGSAISVAANLVTVSLGTETDGSILCPSSFNSVVGLKPTVGLTRAGVIPVTPRQDTIGPICRTVSDAVYVLDAIVGFDSNDEATRYASYYIPPGGYKRFLNPCGLKGKRLGIVRNPFFKIAQGLGLAQTFENHLHTLRRQGAIVVDNLQIANIDVILNVTASGEAVAIVAEFKLSLNAYLRELVASSVRSLADIIAFNLKFPDLELTDKIGQDIFLAAQATNGIGAQEKAALANLENLSKNGLEKLMRDYKLDAVVIPRADASSVYAIGGFPAIIVPAGYDSQRVPIGISFGGLKGSEGKLIEITYAFEQATKIRKPPPFKP
ncbi:hypothetical protein PVK06_004595 [Gossypium arboreum]|uniref:Amidase domain-containing protein n=1 Tax=Gossypium arboreum TaxID=29729 RepID=A0ABR0QSE8_GOSAR|nr:hypothetical protein PVK06_004595 [Gossypium arboreum]